MIKLITQIILNSYFCVQSEGGVHLLVQENQEFFQLAYLFLKQNLPLLLVLQPMVKVNQGLVYLRDYFLQRNQESAYVD